MQALAHLLGLIVEQLLGHFFPGEAQVAHHGDQAQANIATRRKQQRTRIAVILRPRASRLNCVVRQVAGGDHVRQRHAAQAAGAAALGQMRLDEVAVLAGQLAERIAAPSPRPRLCVQRLPAPPASDTTATMPSASACMPVSR